MKTEAKYVYISWKNSTSLFQKIDFVISHGIHIKTNKSSVIFSNEKDESYLKSDSTITFKL